MQQVALASTFSVCMCLKFARDTMNTSYILLVSVFQFCSTSTGMVSVLPSVMSSVHDSRMSAKDMHVLKGVCCCLLLQYLIQSCARGGRRIVEDMCYEIQRAEACVD